MPIKFICQHCNAEYQSAQSHCIKCNRSAFSVVGGRLLDLTKSEMLTNLAAYERRKEMNNLEYMHAYQVEKLAIADLSNDQLISFRKEKLANIERERMQIQASEHLLRERGLELKEKQKDSDRLFDNYIPPAETQLDKLEKKLSKKGESSGTIAEIKTMIRTMNFDDI